MIDWFAESRLVIDYTNRRIDELERQIDIYVKSGAYARAVEPNDDGTKDIHKIVLSKPMPIDFTLIAFEIAGHLRSELDRAGYAVARADNKSGDNAHFPFGENTTQIQGHRTGKNGRSRDIRKDVFDVMVSFQPYPGGNKLLWGLNKICNTNKHDVLVHHTITTMFENAVIWPSSSFIMMGPFPPPWDSAKNEMIVGEVPRGATLEAYFQVIPTVLIGDVEGISGEPAVATLRGILGVVDRILMAIEAEARRLGLPI